MLSVDRQRKQAAQKDMKTPLPPVDAQFSPVEQLSFPTSFPQPDGGMQEAPQVPQYSFPPLAAPAHTAGGPITSPGISEPAATEPEQRQLMGIETSVVPAIADQAAPRERVVIHATRKTSPTPWYAPRAQGKRIGIHITVSALLLLIFVTTLLAVVPVGANGQTAMSGLFNPTLHIATSRNNNTGLIAAQAATATAVTRDGYDPGGGQTYAGVYSAPVVTASDSGSLNRFFYGQCTYWANMRYHQLTGHWVPWLGNAAQWAYAAPSYGWVVSSRPNPHGPSIIVLQAGVQGAGWYGHVAIVESINADGSVLTSNWNWLGNWANETWVTFYPGPGVSFVWYP